MKKFSMCLLGTMMVLSLAACTPTPEKQAQTAESFETQAPGGAEDKVPDPNAPVLSSISVYVPKEDNSGLTQEMDGVEVLDAQSVVDKMIEYGVLDEGTSVIDFTITGEPETSAEESSDEFVNIPPAELGTLNLSQVPEENAELIEISIGNTFTENFNVDKIKLLVNGENYADQGDEDYLYYVSSYGEIK